MLTERVAESVLAGDRAKSAEFGGQKLSHVASVDVIEQDDLPPTLRVVGFDGREASAVPLPHLVNRPKDREMRPADLHDAVYAAIVEAAASIAPVVN